MKSAILVFLGGFLAIEIQAQFFQYYHSFAPPQPYVPFLQPPVIPQPQFFYHQQFQPQLQQPSAAFNRQQQFQPQLQQPSAAFNRQQQFQPQLQQPAAPFNQQFQQSVVPFRTEEAQVGGDNYLGYSYRTRHEGGASSTVVFFTGHVQNVSTVFKSPTVTVASDSVDPNRSMDVEESIQKELNGRKEKSSFASPDPSINLFPFVSSILGNSQVPFGTFHYYQTDGLPASTALLKSVEIPSNTNITSRFPEQDASKSTVEDSTTTVNGTSVTSTESNEAESTTVEADFEGESSNEVTTIISDDTGETDEVVSTTTEAISISTISS